MDQPASPPSSPPNPLPGVLFRHLPQILIVLLPAALVLNALRSGSVIVGKDMEMGIFHLFAVVGKSLSAGRLPVWDPTLLLGYPLLAAVQGAVFYPFTWLGAILEPAAFWNLAVFVHAVLAGLFTHAWLTRSLGICRWSAFAGACVAILSGFFLLRVYAGHITHVFAFPWIPALLWRTEALLERKTLIRGIAAAVPVTLLVFSGAPHYALLASLTVAARLVHFLASERREGKVPWTTVAAVGGSFLLALLLAAPQLLPTLDLLPHTQRTLPENAYKFNTSFSLPPENLLTLIAPTCFGDDVSVPYWGRWFLWEACAFVGIASLSMAALALAGSHPHRWLWLGIAAGALLLALGKYTPLYRIAYAVIPGVDFFRAPGRYLCIFVLSTAALTGLGLEALRRDDPASRRRAIWLAGGIGVLLILIVFAVLAGSGVRGEASDRWRETLEAAEKSPDHAVPPPRTSDPEFQNRSLDHARAGLQVALFTTVLVGAAVWLRARGILGPRAGSTVITVILVAELLFFGSRYVRGAPASPIEASPSLVESIRSHPASPLRVTTPFDRDFTFMARLRASGIEHVGGEAPLILSRYAELMNMIHRVPIETRLTWVSPRAGKEVLRMLGARLWLVPEDIPSPPGLREVARAEGVKILEDSRALPRAFIVPAARAVDSDTDRLRILADDSFDPRSMVVLDLPADSLPSGPGSGGTVRILSSAPGVYELEAESKGGGYLVLAESHFPGWSAEIDGTEAEVYRANHVVQAVRLPPGRHRVRFAYRSRYLGAGFLLAGVGVLAPLCGLLWRRRLAARRP